MKKILGIIFAIFFLASCNYEVYNSQNIPSTHTVVYAHIDKPQTKYSSSSPNQLEAQKNAKSKCENFNASDKIGCLRYSTSTIYPDGQINENVGWDKAVAQYKKWEAEGFPNQEDAFEKLKKQIEEERNQIANNNKKKKQEEEEKRIADAKKKQEEEEKRIADAKKKQEEEEKRIADAKKKQEEEERKNKEEKNKLYIIGSGTGFFVSAEGHVVSNDHVVGICKQVVSEINGEFKYFNVLKTDEVNDLGLIKGDYKSTSFLSIKIDGAEFGEDIIAFGYPLSDSLSTSVKLTRGIVSSLSGPGNNYSEIQIDAAIQPGNSGGPVLNMDGQVVGVASSGLNKLYMLQKSEYIPENVNFAVAAPTLANFLKGNGVIISNQKFKIGNTKELANIGRPSTLQLFCLNTKAVHDELKEKKKHSDVLFEKVIEFR